MNPAKLYPQPHPVLSPYGDDFVGTAFDFKVGEPTVNTQAWQVPITACGTDSPELNTLIRMGAAYFAIHAECPGTLWRRLFRIDSLPYILEIPTDLVHGRVTFFPCLLAGDDLRSYRSGEFHEDYGSSTFAIKTGDFLALGRQHEFDALLDYDPLENVGGILEITKHDDPLADLQELCFDADRIILTLPAKSYETYTAARMNPQVSSLLLASMIQPVILHGLNYLRENYDKDLDELKQCLWARSMLVKLEQLCPTWRDSPEEIFKACQLLLKKPAEGALGELANIIQNA